MRLIPRFGYRLWTSKMTAALKLMVIKSKKVYRLMKETQMLKSQ
jgi:hypothetical protein